MKKFTLFLSPLMVISFLTNCNSRSKLYTVTFDSDGGTPVASQTVEEKKCATKPDNPNKDTAEATYTFIHWELDNNEFDFTTPIDKDITLVAKWNKGPTKEYNITWKMDDGTTLRTDRVEYDKMPDYGKAPTKDSTAQYDYTFVGWNPTITKVSSDATYTAKFTETLRKYKVTVSSEDVSKGTVTGSGSYDYGSSVNITATPNDGYKFNGWYDGETKVSDKSTYKIEKLEKDITYTANFTENAWYVRSDWWNYCSNGKDGEQAVAKDIGKEVNLTVNNQVHKVRLIDVNHDDLANGGKAHCTFEFSNLLSDKDGYSLATLWDTSNDDKSTNRDYLNSDLRKALDGSGNGTLRWYRKESKTMSTDTDYTKPVIDMLPSDLKNKIQTVKKKIAANTSYTINSYPTKVFALTYREMTTSSSSYAKEEGTTYQYYKAHYDQSSRIKQQVKGREGAVSGSTTITDLKWNPDNYAGVNYSRNNYGSLYWLASPYASSSASSSWYVNYDGSLRYRLIYEDAYNVAPAFCI